MFHFAIILRIIMKLNSADLFSTRITSSQSDSTWNNLIHGEVAIARVGGHRKQASS